MRRLAVALPSSNQAGTKWDFSGNQIFRFVPPALNFVQVPGSLVSISVGSGGGVWGTNSSHEVFAFSHAVCSEDS